LATQPRKHEITKDLPKEVREIADSAIDHIGRFIDNLNARDLVYVISYLSATMLIYETITKTTLSLQMFLRPKSLDILGQRERGKAFLEDVDRHALLISFVGAYGLLKLDLGDVSSAVGKITTALAAIPTI